MAGPPEQGDQGAAGPSEQGDQGAAGTSEQGDQGAAGPSEQVQPRDQGAAGPSEQVQPGVLDSAVERAPPQGRGSLLTAGGTDSLTVFLRVCSLPPPENTK